MIVKLLTEHHLEFLSLKGGCRGSSESTLVKMQHCWKSRVTAHITVALVMRFSRKLWHKGGLYVLSINMYVYLSVILLLSIIMLKSGNSRVLVCVCCFFVLSLPPSLSLSLLIILFLFKHYFKRVALLAKLANLPSGPL